MCGTDVPQKNLDEKNMIDKEGSAKLVVDRADVLSELHVLTRTLSNDLERKLGKPLPYPLSFTHSEQTRVPQLSLIHI